MWKTPRRRVTEAAASATRLVRDEDSDISGSTPSRRMRWLWVVAGAAAIGVTVVLTIVLTAGLR